MKLKDFTIKDRTDSRGIYRITLLVFVVLSLIGTIPYLISGSFTSFADALFESVSGFTTTGATCMKSENLVPLWILVYRAFTQWIGGALILVFLSALLKNYDADSAYSEEGSSAQLYRSGIRFNSIAFRLLFTYAAMTLACFLVLMAVGFKSTGAALYALSIISTGGRGAGATINMSLSNGMQTSILLFMILACISFTFYYHVIKKHFERISKSTELFAYIVILAGGSLIVVLNLYFSKTYGLNDAVHNGIFEAVSAATTTGMDIVDTSNWPGLSQTMLTLLSFTGGCTASVGSGMKIMRIVILGKLVTRSFITRIHPNAVVAIKMNGKRVPESIIDSVVSHFLIMACFFTASVFIISFEAGSIQETLHLTSYLINNTGGSYCYDYSSFMKIIMCIVMLAGRLEFYAVLLPFTKNKIK